MNQQFTNSPMEKCDPQIYLGQGRFSNVPHQHKGGNIFSAVTLTDLEEASRLRMLQSVLYPGQQVTSSNTCGYPKQPVDTSGLKCPIIMMTNPFQKQTDTDKTVGAVGVEADPARDMSYSQNIGVDRFVLGSSEQAAAYSDNHHHFQKINAVPGFLDNDASQVSTYRASQHHPVPSNGKQLCGIPQSRLCECTHDNDTEITECENLNDATYAHVLDQRAQWQANNMAPFPPNVVFPCGQQPGRVGTNHYTYNHTEPPHRYRQPPQNHNLPPHNHNLPPHSDNQLPHSHNQSPLSHNQPPQNYTEHPQNYMEHRQNYMEHRQNYMEHRQNYMEHRQNYMEHPQNYTEHPQNYMEHPQNYMEHPQNYMEHQQNYMEHPQNYMEHPQNHTEPPLNMDSVLYNPIQHDERSPRMTGDGATNDPCFLACNSQTRPILTRGPMLARMTSHYRQHPYTTQGQCPTNKASFIGINISQLSSGVGANHGGHQLPGARRGYRQYADIRERERFDIQSHLAPGQVLQVHGAPMTGKSTLVRQAVSDAISSSAQPGHLRDHHINCKGITRFQDFLSLVAQNWAPQHPHHVQPDAVLNMIGSFLQQNPDSHHVLVFHKCENLRQNPHSQHFLEFLTMIIDTLATLSVSIVFTTYKYYWTPPRMLIAELEVGVLSVIDIIKLLQYYVPHIDDCVSYANVLAKTFCFPEAVCLIAEEYLVVRNCHVTPDKLEKIINKNVDLLSQLFESRLQEVDTWVSKQDLRFLTHFKHSIENSFTEAHLEYVNSSDLDQVHLQKMISYLKQNHLVRSLPGIRRLVIHPLIVYHSMVSSSRDRQLLPEQWLDNTQNRYIHFLGRVLMSIEANMHEHGRKGLVFAGLIQEWPNVQYVFQMALHCNRNTYGNFIKVAITASNYILKIFPREAESFYWSLYNSAKDYGTPVELAVMEAFLGQAVAEGTDKQVTKTSKSWLGYARKDWSRADQYLSSAIERLSTFGNSYFLGWAIIRKGIIYHRQGKYRESNEYFEQASNVLSNVNRWALGEQFVVPEPKIDEEIITQRIHRTIPIIFTGRNREARRCLNRILDLIQNSFENHPDIATLLNLIGLTEQRGNRDTKQALLWYKLSYNERMYWAKACPESLLAVLNNIGMIYFYQGDSEESLKYLEKALAIRRECGWTHYYTGLTLVHVAEINMKIGNLVQAYKSSLEAERIFAATVIDHDMRLRVNFSLSHIRVLIRQALEPQDEVREIPTRMQSQEDGGQDEGPTETRGTQERHNGAEENRADASNSAGQRKTSLDTSEDSVTSSQFFGAGSGSQHSCNNSQQNITPDDILRIRAAEIEPCDLRMSAEDYFEKILAITSSIHGTLSDDGLSVVLSSYEHLMLLNLGNSPEKFEEYRTALAAFSEDNPWLDVDGDTDTGVDSKYRCLIKHKSLYNYVWTTPYSHLDIRIFVQHMMNACLTCKFIDDAFRVDIWETEAVHCIQKRELRKRLMQRFDTRRPNTQHGSAGNDTTRSSDLSNKAACNTVELKQNCVSSNLIHAQTVSPTKSEMILQQMSAFPNSEELLSPVQDDARIMELHHPIASDQCEGHRQTLEQLLNQTSLMSPRIIKTQEEILKRIQSRKDSCSLLASMAAEKSLSDGSGVGRKTCVDRRRMAVPGFLTSREPVEQSYHGEQDPAWSSDGSPLHQSDTTFFRQASICSDIHSYKIKPHGRSQTETENLGQRKGHMHDECGIPCRQTSEENKCNSRQILADTDHRNIATDHRNIATDHRNIATDHRNIATDHRNIATDHRNIATDHRNIATDHRNIATDHRNIATDHVGDEILPGLIKSQLVLEKCRSGQTSQSDPTSGQSGDLHFSTSEHKCGQDSSENKTGKTSKNDNFSVLDYIRNGFNMNVSTSAEPAASTSRNHEEGSQHPAQQLPQEEHQVARVHDEKVDGMQVTMPVSSRSSLGNTTTLPSLSPSRKPQDAVQCTENYLRLHTASAGKHRQQSVTERQPQSLHSQSLHSQSLHSQSLHLQSLHSQSLQPHLQCASGTGSPDDFQDSDLDSALVHNMNDSERPNRRASNCESSAFPRSRGSSSLSLSGSSHRGYSHATSNSESGYISGQHQTGMSTTRSIEGALSTARRHENYFSGSHIDQAFSDIPFHSSHGLPTEVGRTNAMTEATSGRMRTQTENMLATLTYIQALTQKHNFPDQSLFLQTDTLQQHSQEQQQAPQPEEGSQTNNQVTESSRFLLLENPNNQISLREAVEQSWNETLVPNLTQISADVTDVSGCVFRQELLFLENQIQQREYEISPDSEEVTLAENMRSSQS